MHADNDKGLEPLVQAVCDVLRGLGPLPDTAAQVHFAAMKAFRSAGLGVIPEYRQPFVSRRGIRRFGKIDIVVTDATGTKCAIEIDARKPRHGSILKLTGFDGHKVIALRGVDGDCPPGIDALVRVPVRLASMPERQDRRTVSRLRA